MADEKVIPPLADYPQSIAVALWRMEDSRERTIEVVRDLSVEALEWHAEGLQNSIGTLLYHIALIEMDWLYEEMLQEAWDANILALFPHPHRTQDGHLYPIKDVSLADHLARLETTRRCFLDHFKSISIEDYTRVRKLPQYDVTPEWVLHHLAQHEDEHRGEMMTICTLLKTSANFLNRL
jgi:uncharacterized damage-inducible protein DinB